MNATSSQKLGQNDSRAVASSRLASLRRFLEAEPTNARLRRDVVDTAVAAGEFEYLRAFAESRLAASPADAEAQFDRATALIGLKDFAGAFEALLPLDATIPGVRFNTGLCLFALNRFEEARPYFDAGYTAGERSVGQLRCYLRTLHHVGAIDQAIAVANDNATMVATDGELAGICALLSVDAGDIEGAKRYTQLSLAANPDNIDALVSAGTLLSADLDMPRASAAYQRTLELQPENGRAWIGLGLLSMGKGDFSTATQELERGLQVLSSHVGSWHALGWAKVFSGDLDAADKVFQHALELNHNFCESHGSLAVIAAMRGDRAAAERGIEVAERLDRNCMSSRYASSLLAKSPEEGRAMLADLIENVPGQGPKFAAMLRQAPRKTKNP